MLDRLNPASGINQMENDKGKSSSEHLEENNVEESQYTTEIPLPSKGLFYTGLNHGKTSIKIRPLDWRDEDVLSTPSFLENGDTVFNKILDSVIQDPNINSNTLVEIDRKTILIWLRTQAFGPIMSLLAPCPRPGCNHKPEAEWDLRTLNIPSYSEEVEKELLETGGEYSIVTPNSNLRIYLRQPNHGEVENLRRRLKNAKNKNSNGSDKLATETLRTIVSGVQSKEDPTIIIRNKEEIFKYFDEKHLTLFDTRTIKKRIEDISLDYDTAIDIKCPNCGYIQEGVDMPIQHINFFWPDV